MDEQLLRCFKPCVRQKGTCVRQKDQDEQNHLRTLFSYSFQPVEVPSTMTASAFDNGHFCLWHNLDNLPMMTTQQ